MQSIRIIGADFRIIKIYGLITVALIMCIPESTCGIFEMLHLGQVNQSHFQIIGTRKQYWWRMLRKSLLVPRRNHSDSTRPQKFVNNYTAAVK